MLPFQGEVNFWDINPTRWVGLACVALSGLNRNKTKEQTEETVSS
jgi:hypothetical protein